MENAAGRTETPDLSVSALLVMPTSRSASRTYFPFIMASTSESRWPLVATARRP